MGFWNPIHYLSRHHEVHVACLATEGDRQHCETLEKYCASVQALYRTSLGRFASLTNGLTGDPPGTARKYWDPRFPGVLQKAIEKHRIELVEFHHLNTAVYRDAAGTLPSVLREHNIEYVVWERHARQASRLESIYARWVAPRIRLYEAAAAARFDRCVVVSPADADHLRRVCPSARINVIPSGVDTEYFQPEVQVAEEPNKIVLTGSFVWPPKQHNLRVILEQIMPRIRARVPDAQLCVVGRGIPVHLQRLAERTPGVTLTGAVPDVRPYVRSASLAFNYVESGGGIALKVLEAFAMRKAVLSNRLGCEGIDVENGREVLLADEPDSIAEAAARLLGDGRLRERLTDAAYEFVLRKYSWGIVAQQFNLLYSTLLGERAP